MSMGTQLLAIGEALIDWIPEQIGVAIRRVDSFHPVVGGAPANVCGAFARLGGRAKMITQLGQDPFGDKIIDEFKRYHIDCDAVLRTDRANTSLAFVALDAAGGREFSFFRNPGADMLLEPEQVLEEWFDDGFALHFCSVSLGDFPMREAHKRAISIARKKGMMISFDPNLRRALWNDDDALKSAVREFLPLADVLKVSDEELFFLTGTSCAKEAKDQLFVGNVKLILCTGGAKGAQAFTRSESAYAPGVRVKAIDTTGAGDAFIGAFLYKLYENRIGCGQIADLERGQLESFLQFSNRYCAHSVQKHGALASYPTTAELTGKGEESENKR